MKKKLILLVSTIGIVVTVISLVSSFGDSKPIREDTGYVGSMKCCSCHDSSHPEIIKEWQASSHHMTMKSVSKNKDSLENLKMNSSINKKDVLAIIGHEDGGYVFIRIDFQVFPSKGLQIEASFPPHDEIEFEGEKVDAAQKCFGCHTTGYFVSQKKFVEPGVGCEACHGPGKKHVDTNGSDGTIVNPTELPSDRNNMVCGQCHSLGKDPSGMHPFPVMNGGEPFQPGQDLTLGFVDDKLIVDTKGGEYSTFVHSPEPYSNQVCTDCHDPHGKTENPSMLIYPTSALCLRCHGNPITGIAYVNEEIHWGAHKHTCWFCHIYAHLH